MATLEVLGDLSDGSVRSVSTTYSTARAFGGTNSAFTTEHQDPVGQRFITPNYTVYELLYGFDTSALGADATVTAATLELWLHVDDSATNFVVNVRLHDWGTDVTTADAVAGANLGALTLLAHLDTNGIGAIGAYKTFVDDAFAANINKTGFTRIILSSSRTEAATVPTGNEMVEFKLADTTGTSNDPKLTITYTPAAAANRPDNRRLYAPLFAR